ncbi:unnamed protein product [Brachionus calyciflorus]|uniref:Protein CLP1 homolog n=1 Tax=Brachionus calyciflorus TaxID=104777 RepID=A0A813R1X8_9BILA|nr:unnamed protein product [Brachionus calyciflorus]
MSGNLEDAYVASETPMVYYVNIHTALEQLRVKAEETKTAGPRVMVVGPDDVGKTTLCRMLCNWAVRSGHLPIYVDLDVNQNSISLPGTISALAVERTSLVDEGFSVDSQISYHFGLKSINDNPVLYRKLITALRDTISLRSEQIMASLYSGVIINTSGSVKDEGYKSLVHTAEEFEVSIILVLDQERLRVELKRDLPDYIKVLSLPKSGGVVLKSQDTRTQNKNLKIHEYFYGTSQKPLYPHSIEISFNEVNIYKIGAPQLPDHLLPMGMKSEDNSTKIFAQPPTSQLINHLLAVSYADDVDGDDKSSIIETNIAGFLVVTKVDQEKGTFTVLSPQPKPLPSNVLLVSEIQFVDLK